MNAQLRAEQKPASRQLHIYADVDGFLLDLDSTIPDYVSSLIEVYRQGKARVDRLSGATARAQKDDLSPEPTRVTENDYTNLSTSNVFLSLKFRSGRVRMFNQTHNLSTRPRTVSASQNAFERQLGDLESEIFNLPEVSVWGEYRATPALFKVNGRRRNGESGHDVSRCNMPIYLREEENK